MKSFALFDTKTGCSFPVASIVLWWVVWEVSESCDDDCEMDRKWLAAETNHPFYPSECIIVKQDCCVH